MLLCLVVVPLFMLLSSCSLVGADCTLTATRDARESALDATLLEVVGRAGELQIRGRTDLQEVLVSGAACASSQDLLDRVAIVIRREGDRIIVEADLPEIGFAGGAVALDLELEVPEWIAVQVIDSSGSMSIHHVAALRVVKDGSGDIDVGGVTGSVGIDDDGSGNIGVRHVGGDVSIGSDGSGDIHIERVDGAVSIGQDGSGDIEIRHAGGAVSIASDGSGNIKVRGVQGSVSIGNDGSGSIAVHAVRGSLMVRSDGSGSIRYEDVDGEVSVPD